MKTNPSVLSLRALFAGDIFILFGQMTYIVRTNHLVEKEGVFAQTDVWCPFFQADRSLDLLYRRRGAL